MANDNRTKMTNGSLSSQGPMNFIALCIGVIAVAWVCQASKKVTVVLSERYLIEPPNGVLPAGRSSDFKQWSIPSNIENNKEITLSLVEVEGEVNRDHRLDYMNQATRAALLEMSRNEDSTIFSKGRTLLGRLPKKDADSSPAFNKDEFEAALEALSTNSCWNPDLDGNNDEGRILKADIYADAKYSTVVVVFKGLVPFPLHQENLPNDLESAVIAMFTCCYASTGALKVAKGCASCTHQHACNRNCQNTRIKNSLAYLNQATGVLRSITIEHPTAQIYLTGIGFNGALAALASISHANEHSTLRSLKSTVTFGSPGYAILTQRLNLLDLFVKRKLASKELWKDISSLRSEIKLTRKLPQQMLVNFGLKSDPIFNGQSGLTALRLGTDCIVNGADYVMLKEASVSEIKCTPAYIPVDRETNSIDGYEAIPHPSREDTVVQTPLTHAMARECGQWSFSEVATVGSRCTLF